MSISRAKGLSRDIVLTDTTTAPARSLYVFQSFTPITHRAHYYERLYKTYKYTKLVCFPYMSEGYVLCCLYVFALNSRTEELCGAPALPQANRAS